jgi:hypothetical protein
LITNDHGNEHQVTIGQITRISNLTPIPMNKA